MALSSPSKITDSEKRFDSFKNGKALPGKNQGLLPAMGWNSWNAFGSGNTEVLTKAMADCIINLGLDKLGYKYLVLDDGCYKSERVDGKLSNEDVKFPSGFKALSDYIHAKGLKFGMYNDIGTNLCAGAAVGTCGHEDTDAKSYIDWGVDFLKIDNCYYLWDNATFSNPENARFVFAPKIKNLILNGTKHPVTEGKITGQGAQISDDKTYVFGIGTFDGTNTGTTPVGERSGEFQFEINSDSTANYQLQLEYATSKENLIGEWLQVAVNWPDGKTEYFYDDLLTPTKDKDSFQTSEPIIIKLQAGKNIIRLMNHRRQENTLDSYAAMLEGLNKANPGHNILLSLCEWGKTHPQNWGYKVGNSWRILNDITFRVGSDGNPGFGAWKDPGTPSVTSQYNKAVVMDEFAGLDKGWNDPDMLMIGMDGLNLVQNKTHFTMWCMMNSPLMLGLDLRRISKGDDLYNIISNKELIALNQDPLGIQAKRVFTSAKTENDGKSYGQGKDQSLAAAQPDKAYIEDIDRIDILAKPLSDGSLALSFINVSESDKRGSVKITAGQLTQKLAFWKAAPAFAAAKSFTVKNLWTGESSTNTSGTFEVTELPACDNITLKITPLA